MSTNPRSRKALKRSFSDSDLPRRTPEIEVPDPRLDSESHDLRSSQRLPTTWLEAEEIQEKPPPLPPRPAPRNNSTDIILPQGNEANKRTWFPPWARRVSQQRLETTMDRADADSVRADQEHKDRDSFIKHKRGIWRRLSKANTRSDLHLMSGAMPNDSEETLPSKSVTFSDPALTGPEIIHDSTFPPSSDLRVRFGSDFDADDVLHPSGFTALSDSLSCQGMYQLSRCATPIATDVRSSSGLRRNLVTVDEVTGSSPGANPITRDSRAHFKHASLGSIAARLPTELLQKIYEYLGPYDFNAARHTCIGWMSASLNLELLTEQLKRGGWWSAASTQPLLFHEWRHAWPMSCYLAREVALSGSWTGQGLSSSDPGAYNPMVESCCVNFSALGGDIAEPIEHHQNTEAVSTASVCGRYYVTARGAEIYTYEIEGCSLHLLGRTSCERRVLAVTLSASTECFAIAAILEGRIGVYVNMLSKCSRCGTNSPWERPATLNNEASSAHPIMDFGTAEGTRSTNILVGEFDELSVNADSVGSHSILHQSVELVTQRTWAEYIQGPCARLRGMRRMPSSTNGVWPNALNFRKRAMGQEYISSRPQLVYRNLCTEEDPPSSIAISPSRQCVAFGCGAGVELYWVDPLTGQNLNRWFALAKPSEHLYFLPPRPSIDGTFRLRLISSASFIPPEDPAAQERAAQSPHNETGLLSLGSDRPAGELQRLSRKFVFEPPSSLHDLDVLQSPQVYAAARDLSNGVRIAAAYGTNIVLYSVPVDALRFSTAEQEQTLQDSSKPFEELEWLEVLLHPTSNAANIRTDVPESAIATRFGRLNMKWAHYLSASGEHAHGSLDRLWPLRTAGTCIGSLDGVKALSVQVTDWNGLVVWAFSNSGLAKAWKVDSGQRPTVHLRSTVGPDGSVWKDEKPDEENTTSPL